MASCVGYPDNWHTSIKPKVLARDKHRCTRCGAANGQLKINMATANIYKVTLAVSHFDHDRENHSRLSKLKTMCQACRINYYNKTDPMRDQKRQEGYRKSVRRQKTAEQKRLERLERQYYYWGER